MSLFQVMPDLTPEEFDSLKADIALRGVLVPVEKDEVGNILDGHHRVRACEDLGISDYPVIVRSGMSEDQKRAHALALNLYRRQLDPERRAPLVAQLRAEGWSYRRIADAAGVSYETVRRDASGVTNVTPDANPPAVVGKDGKVYPASRPVSVFAHTPAQAQSIMEMVADAPTALDRLQGGFASPKDVERAVRAEVRSIARESRSAALVETHPEISDRARLFVADITDAATWRGQVEPESVDVIVTDPPYPAEFLPTFGALAHFAVHALKPGGLLVCMSGQAHFPQVMLYLTQFVDLRYHWLGAYLTPGGQAAQVWPRRVNTFWKPLIVMCKGDYEGEWFGDVTRSDVNDNDKRFHEWGQSESGMADIIARFSLPADVVCDPFVGGGATAVAALAGQRRFVGFDIDAERVGVTARRIGDVC